MPKKEQGDGYDDEAAAAASSATTTTGISGSTSTSTSISTKAKERAPPGIGEAILGTSLWEAAYDQDQAVLGKAAMTGDDEEEEEDTASAEASAPAAPAAPPLAAAPADYEDERGSLHYVTIGKGSKLGVRVRDDDSRLPKTCMVTHFDLLPTGEPGPIQASGVVAIGDFLVKVDDVSVEGKDVREVLGLIRGAPDDAVILTFRRLRAPAQEQGEGENAESTTATTTTTGPYPLHLTEQHRALILRHLLFGGNPHIPEDRLRFLAARGVPDCDRSLRPVVWRILLQYLGYDRDGWEAHLRDQRQIYAQFVADLCVLPEEEGAAAAADAAVKQPREQEKQTAAAATTAAPESPSSGATTPDGKPKKKLLVPSDMPPRSSSSSFDLDASASFAGLNRIPVARKAARTASSASSSSQDAGHDHDHAVRDRSRSKSIGASTSTSTSGAASVLGASAAGSQPHFAFARPKTRARYQGDRALFDEIKKDVVRTYPDQAWFLDMEHGSRRYDCLMRALFIYAKVNPGIRYVQGLNELMGTILFVLATDPDPAWAAHAEADAFFLFTNLMAQMRDLFQESLDQAESGIEGRIGELVDLLALHDPQLHAHFAKIGLNAHFFVLRWMTTLFARELLLPDTVRVWDSMLADPAPLAEFVVFFALSMILEQREALLANGFSYCLQLLQNYPSTTDVQALLHRAEALRAHDAALRRQRGHHRRGSSSSSSSSSGGPLSPSKLRGVLAKVASRVEDHVHELPAALDSLSVESRRAGAQIRSSLVHFSKLLVESVTVLDDDNSSTGKSRGKELPSAQRRMPAPPAAAAASVGEGSSISSSSDDEEEQEDEEDEGGVKMMKM